MSDLTIIIQMDICQQIFEKYRDDRISLMNHKNVLRIFKAHRCRYLSFIVRSVFPRHSGIMKYKKAFHRIIHQIYQSDIRLP